jgi:hypothetical protein
MPTAPRKDPENEEPEDVETPDLLERVFGSGCTRIAVVSLHPGAGARTVVETLAAGFRERGIRVGVTRVPRVGIDGDSDHVTDVSLPAESVVATAASVVPSSDALEPLERVECRTPLGEIAVCRVKRPGEVPVYAPHDAATLGSAVGRLEALGDGFVLVAGAWERRSFAAPEVAQAVVLAVGADYSGTVERSAAAVRYAVELLGLGRHDVPVDLAWREAVQQQESLVLDRNGRVCGSLASSDPDSAPPPELLEIAPSAIVVPEYLSDDFLAPLARSSMRCTIVVKDATRIRVSPVCHAAWSKTGGRLAIMDPMRLLAVATNPVTATGPDADAGAFRDAVAEAVPEVPVHDAPRESATDDPRPKWRFWS